MFSPTHFFYQFKVFKDTVVNQELISLHGDGWPQFSFFYIWIHNSLDFSGWGVMQ